MMNMNSMERVLTTLNHEEPDQVPIYTSQIDSVDVLQGYTNKRVDLSNAGYGILRILQFFPFWGRTAKYFFQRRFINKIGLKPLVKLYEQIGLDLLTIPATMLPIGKSGGFNLTKPGLTTPNWTNMVCEYGRISSFYQDKESELTLMNYVGGIHDSEADDLEEIMAHYENWAPLDPNNKSRYYAYEGATKIAGNQGPYVIPGVGGFFEVTWESFGFENYSKLLFQHPDFIEEVTKNNHEFSLGVTERLIEKHQIEAIIVWDDLGYKTGTFISPRQYMKLIYPKMKSYVNFCHKHGVKVLLHSCGNLNKILDKIIDTGIDGLNPIEPSASMDIFQINQDHGDRITLIGNVDIIHLLAKGTPQDVENYVKKLIEHCAPGGGLIIASGHSINPQVPFENYDSMIQATRKYGKYPINITNYEKF